ncbi:MAG TPA: hypothetical protein VGI45_08080 [Terracidiphilus sp.]|jgi:hypothetical protein
MGQDFKTSTLVTAESRTITVRIGRRFDQVYDFLADPKNWNQWAHGLGKSIRQSTNSWVADSDGGTVEVRFTPRNSFGIVDHYVIRPSGAQVYVPMRLIVSGQGCELLFTLFREPQMSDQQFAADLGYVQRDLDDLKSLLEKEGYTFRADSIPIYTRERQCTAKMP